MSYFRQLHHKNASVFFLQETYSSNNQEKLWGNELGSKIHYWHGSKHSNGVAILLNPKLQVTIESQMQSEDGIKWLETPICALGISFSFNHKLCEWENSTPSYIWWKFPTSPLLGGGALVSCSTSTPINHIVFFLQNTGCIRKPQVISVGGAHPLHPPRSAPVISWWNHQSGDGYLVDELSSLCGYNPEDKRTLIFNYFFSPGRERHLYWEIRTENPDHWPVFWLC